MSMIQEYRDYKMSWIEILKTIVSNYLAKKLVREIEKLEIKLDNKKRKLSEKLK